MIKKRRMLIVMGFVLILTVTGCHLKDNKKNQQTVLTINDTDIDMNEMMYYIY